MTTEELLKPRYKVLGRYPDSPLHEGQIITSETFNSAGGTIFHCQDYPLIFRKLEWWEERKEAAMPDYVKFRDNVVVKVEHHFQDKLTVTDGSWPYRYSPDSFMITLVGEQYSCPYYDVTPATKDEFEKQI